jgi:hypothetical protein
LSKKKYIHRREKQRKKEEYEEISIIKLPLYMLLCKKKYVKISFLFLYIYLRFQKKFNPKLFIRNILQVA